MTEWGPTGQAVYDRTYRRIKANGEHESWIDTVTRVVDGNLGLVPSQYHLKGEREALISLIRDFDILPAGRHLWMSGVPGRQYLFNCHHAGWGDDPWDHYVFAFNQLMQGGGVGANYSGSYSAALVNRPVSVHIVCAPEHPDYAELESEGYLSADYCSDYAGAEVVEDTREGWAQALEGVLKSGFTGENDGIRIYDVSNIRHRGSRIKTFGGTAAGPTPLAKLLTDVSDILTEVWLDRTHVTPISAMKIDHAIAQCVVAGNVRRSARMSIVNWSDPYVFDFIECKSDPQAHWSTNISVEVDEAFFAALNADNPNGDHARAVLYAVSEGMLLNGEPGIYNRALAQVGEVGQVSATNPCGEVPLEEWENCNLGHVNLAHYVNDLGRIDYAGMRAAAELMARFLVRATFGDVPDPKQREVLDRNRRIFVGVFGYQGWVNRLGLRYSNAWLNPEVRGALGLMSAEVREAADAYAFQLRIPAPIKTTGVAPTGTIAKLSGDSEGIHPIFARYFIRRVRFSLDDPEQSATVARYVDEGYDVEPDLYNPRTAVVSFPTRDPLVEELGPELVEDVSQISLDDMLGTQAMVQERYADNAVSFTANVSPGQYTVTELYEALRKWLPRLKGVTVFPEMSRPQSPYERLTEAQLEAYENVSVSDGIDEECATGACPVR